jgi:hypothetical protein
VPPHVSAANVRKLCDNSTAAGFSNAIKLGFDEEESVFSMKLRRDFFRILTLYIDWRRHHVMLYFNHLGGSGVSERLECGCVLQGSRSDISLWHYELY